MVLLCLTLLLCSTAVGGSPVPILKDMQEDLTTIVSPGHLIQAFSTMGQLHIEAPSSRTNYHVNLYSYSALMGHDLEELTLAMQFTGFEGFLKWYEDSGTWKLEIDECEKDFDVAPTASSDSKYHWVVLMTDQKFYLKCNNVVVVSLLNDECYPKVGQGKLGIGGWELIRMVGLRARFENLKNIGSCSMPSYYYNDQRGLMGIKKLTTGEDCRYDCQHTTGCEKVTIDLAENACKLYSSYGGRGKYFNDHEAGSGERYLNYVFGTLSSFELSCFDYKEDPCWRDNVRFEVGADETTAKSIEHCLEDEYTTASTAMWNPVTGRCASIHDTYVKINEIHAPGFSVMYSMCNERKDQVGYDSCYEYGVILEGKVMAETTYKFPYDCKEACEAEEDCSGWTSLTELKKCYLYTGAVYRVEYNRAVSGTYDCLTDLAPVPQKVSRLVEPVATEFDLLTVSEPGTLNLFINDDDIRRTIHVYEDGSESFKFDFYSRKQNADFDIQIEGCPDAFNYTKQPCALKRKSQNFFSINLLEDSSELTIFMYCGESADEILDYEFFSEDNLVANCGLSINKWNGIKFENFQEDDKYSFGLTADFPDRVQENPTGTYAPP